MISFKTSPFLNKLDSKVQKGTYRPTYIALQYPAEMNTSGRKTPTTLILFQITGGFSINKDLYLCGSLHNTIIIIFLPQIT